MKNFQQLVARYAGGAPTLGPAQSFPTDALKNDLRNMVEKNSRYFLVIFILLVVLLLLCVAVLARFLDQPAKAAALLAASGISIPFVLRMMLRMWDSKVKSEALLILATSVDEKMLRTIVTTLAHGLKAG